MQPIDDREFFAQLLRDHEDRERAWFVDTLLASEGRMHDAFRAHERDCHGQSDPLELKGKGYSVKGNWRAVVALGAMVTSVVITWVVIHGAP